MATVRLTNLSSGAPNKRITIKRKKAEAKVRASPSFKAYEIPLLIVHIAKDVSY